MQETNCLSNIFESNLKATGYNHSNVLNVQKTVSLLHVGKRGVIETAYNYFYILNSNTVHLKPVMKERRRTLFARRTPARKQKA